MKYPSHRIIDQLTIENFQLWHSHFGTQEATTSEDYFLSASLLLGTSFRKVKETGIEFAFEIHQMFSDDLKLEYDCLLPHSHIESPSNTYWIDWDKDRRELLSLSPEEKIYRIQYLIAERVIKIVPKFFPPMFIKYPPIEEIARDIQQGGFRQILEVFSGFKNESELLKTKQCG